MSDILTPDQAARLLRAKAAELEAAYLAAQGQGHTVIRLEVNDLRADIALIATLVAQHLEAHALADHVERTMPLPKTKGGKA
jgi:hypothetical protein